MEILFNIMIACSITLGGHLIFDEKDVELMADNILIVEGGSLTVGFYDNLFPFIDVRGLCCSV